MNGEIYPMDNAFWTKFVVNQVEPNEHIPHGIVYSLTLHDKHHTRILGYDNAHAIKPKRKRFAAKRIIWDHKHKYDTVEPYEFEIAAQLLEDFWKDVNELIDAGE